MQTQRTARPKQTAGFPRVASLCAAIFLSLAVGYVLSLSAFSFDIVIPSFFIWALVCGFLLSTAGDNSAKRIFVDSAAAAAAFTVSPFLFGSLRGLLAAQANEIPNDALVFGYGVLKLDATQGVSGFVITLAIILFAISFLLLLVATFSSTAIRSFVVKIFKFGPKGLDDAKAVLVKSGAIVLVIASAVLAVANLSRTQSDPQRFQPSIPSSQIGTLWIYGPDRGRLHGSFHTSQGAFDVFLSPRKLEGLLPKETLEDLSSCPTRAQNAHGVEADCDVEDIEDSEIRVSSYVWAYGSRHYIIDSIVRVKPTR